MSPPEKKRKTERTTEKIEKKKKQSPNPSLPDELILIIIARVSILYYPTLSLVSKKFRSLIASPELYKARSLLGNIESCIYVCFRLNPGFRWFTLCRKPNQTLTINDTSEKKKKKKKSSAYVLATVSFPQSPKQFSNLVAVGSDIYSIGRSTLYYDDPSSKVSDLDCRSHTWRKAPRMKDIYVAGYHDDEHSNLVHLLLLSSGVIDRKIYVAGYHDDEHSNLKNSFQVFDTVTQIWDPEPISFSKSGGLFYAQSACVDGKFHVMTDKDVLAYDSKERRWDMVGRAMKEHFFSSTYREIDNVLYSFRHGMFRWYDTEVRVWRNLLGLVGLPEFPRIASVIMIDYGGKMMVFWDDYEPYYKPGEDYLKLICCAEIMLERWNSNEICGHVEWFDTVAVAEVPNIYRFVNVVAPTL